MRPGRLTLLCHGATADTRQAAFATSETPLEAAALRHLPALLERRPENDGVYAAPSRAARDTARALGFDATVEPSLRDCDFGCWTGKAIATVAAEDGEAFRRWLVDPGVAPHGGESLALMIARVRQWLDGYAVAPGSRLAIASPLVVRAAVVAGLALPAAAIFGLDTAPLGVTRLTYGGNTWRLAAFKASS